MVSGGISFSSADDMVLVGRGNRWIRWWKDMSIWDNGAKAENAVVIDDGGGGEEEEEEKEEEGGGREQV